MSTQGIQEIMLVHTAGVGSMIGLAQDLASDKGHVVITTGHFLAAMLSPRLDSISFKEIFKGCDVASAYVEKHIKPIKPSKNNKEYFCFSQNAEKLMKAAVALAATAGDSAVDVNHFFNAIYTIPDCQAYKILSKKLSPDQINSIRAKSGVMLCEHRVHKAIQEIGRHYNLLKNSSDGDTMFLFRILTKMVETITNLQTDILTFTLMPGCCRVTLSQTKQDEP
ncbi:MAG: hypothetical protein M1338_00285 [Patescibacteria group bacterium]|nr:hypothetical protein [Patescibacteria group bacterium]